MGAWRSDFIDGNVRGSCSICGRSRRIPDEMILSADRLWRCLDSCVEETRYEIDLKLSVARQRRPEPEVSIGIKPPFDP